MKRTVIFLALAGLCLASLPLHAQDAGDTPDEPDTPDVAPAVGRGQRVFAGEVHEVGANGFQIMPWVARFPRRMEVITNETTRYFDLQKGHQKDLKPGDAVMFVLGSTLGLKKVSPVPPVEEPPAETPPGAEPVPLTPKQARDKKKAEDKKKADYDKKMAALLAARASPIRGVVRLWPARDTVLTPQELRDARFIMQAAVPYFQAKRQQIRIADRKSVFPGIVLSLTPLTLRIDDRKQEFRLTGDAIVVNTVETTAKNMKHGQTVLLRSKFGPKDGKVDATMVTVCPQPSLESAETRRILAREVGLDEPKK